MYKSIVALMFDRYYPIHVAVTAAITIIIYRLKPFNIRGNKSVITEQ